MNATRLIAKFWGDGKSGKCPFPAEGKDLEFEAQSN